MGLTTSTDLEFGLVADPGYTGDVATVAYTSHPIAYNPPVVDTLLTLSNDTEPGTATGPTEGGCARL